jgi:hypothetical protein
MAIDEPASGSGSRGELDERSPGAGPGPFRHLPWVRSAAFTRSSLALPWRNFRRVVFLIFALLAVVALKKSAGGFFNRLVDAVAAPPPAAPARSAAPATTVHLQPGPPPR